MKYPKLLCQLMGVTLFAHLSFACSAPLCTPISVPPAPPHTLRPPTPTITPLP